MKLKLPKYEALSDKHPIMTFKNWSRSCNRDTQRNHPQSTIHI